MSAAIDEQHLPLRAIAPGLILILVVDILTVSGIWPLTGWSNLLLSGTLIGLPWATLIVLRKPIQCLGYNRNNSLRAVGWGIVAGGFWRLLSLLFNLWWLRFGDQNLLWVPQILAALIWIPWVEETFFRGYLGRTLAGKIGVWPGIMLQATLFTLQPVHWNQGWGALLSVLGFGVLAGFLQQRWNSIWPAWGAHAFANLLPLLVYFA
jgi:membrane protease YdiL (CAAX protease family)